MALSASKPPLPSDDKRWRIVNGTMRRYGYARHGLIETLHTVQQEFGALDPVSLKFVAGSLCVPLSQAYGVATFYHLFSLRQPGEHTCLVCTGTACHIQGAAHLVANAEEILGVPAGETTPDGKASLLIGRCLGPCSLGPVAVFDGDVTAFAAVGPLRQRLKGWLSHDA